MNKTEQRMADLLKAKQWEVPEGRQVDVQVRPQGMSLRWGIDPRTGTYMTYTPDFVVRLDWQAIGGGGNAIQWILIEVKGAHIRERDLVRFRGCRADWPEFDFEMWQWKKGEWSQVL